MSARAAAIGACALAAAALGAPAAHAGTIAFSSASCESDADHAARKPPPGPFDQFNKERWCHPGIWTVKDDGTRLARLTGDGPPATVGSGDFRPSWSPSGAFIVFERESSQGLRRLVVVDAAGVAEREITPRTADGTALQASSPVWGAGGRIVFGGRPEGAYPDSELYSMRPDGSDVRALTDTPQNEEPLGVAADGARVLFSRAHNMTIRDLNGSPQLPVDPQSGVYAVSEQGGAEQLITSHGFHNVGASFAPDGRTMALFIGSGSMNDDGATYTMGLDGGGLRRRTRRQELGTAWAGPSTLILSGRLSDQPLYEDRRTSLFRLDLSRDSTPRTPLTPSLNSASDPDWHPARPLREPVADELAPVVGLFDGTLGVPVGSARAGVASTAARRSVRRRALQFVAADRTGIRSVRVAVFRRRGRSCRFLARGRFGRGRSCRRPVYRRIASQRAWRRMVARLAPGTYGFRFATRDVRRNTGAGRRAVYVRLRR